MNTIYLQYYSFVVEFPILSLIFFFVFNNFLVYATQNNIEFNLEVMCQNPDIIKMVMKVSIYIFSFDSMQSRASFYRFFNMFKMVMEVSYSKLQSSFSKTINFPLLVFEKLDCHLQYQFFLKTIITHNLLLVIIIDTKLLILFTIYLSNNLGYENCESVIIIIEHKTKIILFTIYFSNNFRIWKLLEKQLN
jgi:hypothetical protein